MMAKDTELVSIQQLTCLLVASLQSHVDCKSVEEKSMSSRPRGRVQFSRFGGSGWTRKSRSQQSSGFRNTGVVTKVSVLEKPGTHCPPLWGDTMRSIRADMSKSKRHRDNSSRWKRRITPARASGARRPPLDPTWGNEAPSKTCSTYKSRFGRDDTHGFKLQKTQNATLM